MEAKFCRASAVEAFVDCELTKRNLPNFVQIVQYLDPFINGSANLLICMSNKLVSIASDEIFSHLRPILITADPVN